MSEEEKENIEKLTQKVEKENKWNEDCVEDELGCKDTEYPAFMQPND